MATGTQIKDAVDTGSLQVGPTSMKEDADDAIHINVFNHEHVVQMVKVIDKFREDGLEKDISLPQVRRCNIYSNNLLTIIQACRRREPECWKEFSVGISDKPSISCWNWYLYPICNTSEPSPKQKCVNCSVFGQF